MGLVLAGRAPPSLISIGELLNALMNLLLREKGFLFDHASHARRHKVTQSESGSNVNSVSQEEHQKKQRMRFER
jgi:hypothetical protein